MMDVGLDHALQCLSLEDPSLRVTTDNDSGQVKGQWLRLTATTLSNIDSALWDGRAPFGDSGGATEEGVWC